MNSDRTGLQMRASRIPFLLFAGLLLVLWLMGGASRPDVLGQAVVRACAGLVLLVAIFERTPADFSGLRPVATILGCTALIVFVQLIPLPPALWASLPGHGLLTGAATALNEPQPWRPISISPDGTRNALASLLVPAAALFLMAKVPSSANNRVLGVILLGCISSAVWALVQAIGSPPDNPFVNELPGRVSGFFANPNHLALACAIGCALAPWAALTTFKRPAVAVGAWFVMVLVFAFSNFASGSRAGLVLLAVGFILGIFIVKDQIAKASRTLPRRSVLTAAAIAIIMVLGIIAVGVFSDRTEAVDRLEDFDDKRFEIWTTVVDMLGHYFPVGSGFGTFDAAFRISEPFTDLGPKYINQAHNDILQIGLEGGLAGAVLLLAGLAWVLWASWRAWRMPNAEFGRLGSAIVILVLMGSLVDYPARTPIIMAITIIGGSWLSRSLTGRLRMKRG